jgi:trans-aconitate 2-methyltransferase
MSSDTWDPAVYHRFKAERKQPFDDLLALVEPVPGGTVVDLGCGSGELTAELHAHVGASNTIGVDSSANMLEQAAAHEQPGLTFVRADLATWEPPAVLDVVFANASFQWVPDHPTLLRRLRDQLAPRGQLAVQMPANFDHPTHTVADTVGQRFGMPPVARFEAVLPPERYAALLDEMGFSEINVRMQVYVHRLPTTSSVVEWVKGTLLTEYRRELGEEQYEAFLDEYRTQLFAALGDPSGEAPYTHLFKRILFRARQ